MERIPLRPQAVWYISGLANRRVHLGGGIVLTSDSGIDRGGHCRPRSHSHRVFVGFGPPLPKETEFCFHNGATTLLDWHKSLAENQIEAPFEHHGGHCHPQYTHSYFFTHGLRIEVRSHGRRHIWTLKVEQKTGSELEELRSERRLSFFSTGPPLLEWDQMRCEDENRRCLRSGEH